MRREVISRGPSGVAKASACDTINGEDTNMKQHIEGEKFWLCCAIRRCHEVETTGKADTGAYCGEAERKYYEKLNRDGIIFSEPTAGKCHWVSFLGFSPLGRRLYLNQDGSIRKEYALKEDNQVVGLAKPYFSLAFDDTFSKSAEREMSEFVSRYDSLAKSKWFFASDYCLDNPKMKHSVIAFSLFPYLLSFDKLNALMNANIPRDFKETFSLSEEQAKLLSGMPAFHVAVTFPKDFVISGDPSKEHSTMVAILEAYVLMLEKWISADNAGMADDYRKRAWEMNRLLMNMKRRPDEAWTSAFGKHIVAMRNALVVTNLFASLAQRLLRQSPNALFGWLPDRDAIMRWPNAKVKGVIHDIASDYIHIQCVNEGRTYDPKRYVAALPDEQGALWYDFINRIPDYVAGVVSHMDLATGEVPERLLTLRDVFVADNQRLILVSIRSWNEAARIVVNRQQSIR